MRLLSRICYEIFLFYKINRWKLGLFFIVCVSFAFFYEQPFFLLLTNNIEWHLKELYKMVPALRDVSIDHDGGIKTLAIVEYIFFVRVFFRYTLACGFYWLFYFAYKLLMKYRRVQS